MSNAAECTDQLPGTSAESKLSETTYAVLISGLLLLLGLGVSVWMYGAGSRAVPTTGQPASSGAGLHGATLGRSHAWLLWVVIIACGSGTGVLMATVGRLGSRRRALERQVKAWDLEWRKTLEGMEMQLADSRKSEQQARASKADIQRRVDDLAGANSQLRGELEQLKKARLTLTQQQQALQTSKTVLELHVETRTKDLQQLQDRYEHILNAAGEGICGLDAQGKVSFANPAVTRLTGWKAEEVQGKTEQQIFGRNGSELWSASAGRPMGESVFTRKDGTSFPVEFVKTALKDNEHAVGAVLVFKDITERKQVEEALGRKAAELARSNSELEQFAFVASHDLQEPLRKIQAFGDRLKTKCDGAFAAEARDYLERMQNAATRMRALIDDLLAFSRVIRSTEPFVPVELTSVTRGVLSDLEVSIEKSGAKVEVGDLPTIEADPMQMRQLLLNLIGNSLKFQPPGSTPVVKVQARILGSGEAGPVSSDECRVTSVESPPSSPATRHPSPVPLCELSVQDNGIGFEEKYAEKVFAVFQRLHGRNEYEGNGVGLAVCRRIADHHHGTIVGRSSPGQGATFIVTLPVTQPKPAPTS